MKPGLLKKREKRVIECKNSQARKVRLFDLSHESDLSQETIFWMKADAVAVAFCVVRAFGQPAQDAVFSHCPSVLLYSC